MVIEKSRNQLGIPDIKLSGLQIWIHGRQFPEATDYWDGNWLRITAHCGTDDADVWTSGPILNLPALVSWLAELEQLNASLSGAANLVPLEPELFVQLAADRLGHVSLKVEITPNNLTQEHTFHFELDPSFLDPLIASCRKVIAKYPVRGTLSD